MVNNVKIGVIQNEPLTGDFSNNLRHIIQGYRECQDRGAQIVVASAFALTGHASPGLAKRPSFLRQTQKALKLLSEELTGPPLIIGAYTSGQVETDDPMFDELINFMPMSDEAVLAPYILEQDTVTELEETEVLDLEGLSIMTVLGDDELLTDEPIDLLIHLSSSPWYEDYLTTIDRSHADEASFNHHYVLTVRSTGVADGDIFCGGSVLHAPSGKAIMRTKVFETDAKTAKMSAKARLAEEAPAAADQLMQALICGISRTVKNNCYAGVALSMDEANSDVLAALCIESLGRQNVLGITAEGNTTLAEALGIQVKTVSTQEMLTPAADQLRMDDTSALRERFNGMLMLSLADSMGMMMLNSLSRYDIMTGNFSIGGKSAGYLAPLGDLYRFDIAELRNKLHEKYAAINCEMGTPEHPVMDFIIHNLTEKNIGAEELIQTSPEDVNENDIRMAQRKIAASAIKRSQLPLVLNVVAPSKRHSFPIVNRLND